MQARIDYQNVAQGALKAMYGLEGYVRGCGLEHSLLELIKVRVSQINGCAFCIDMHWKDARAAGESEERLYMLNAWRESALYTDRERAALEWAETVTLVADTHVPDDVFERARAQFSEEELVNVTMAVVTINSWNRLAISMRAVPGLYRAKASGESR